MGVETATERNYIKFGSRNQWESNSYLTDKGGRKSGGGYKSLKNLPYKTFVSKYNGRESKRGWFWTCAF